MEKYLTHIAARAGGPPANVPKLPLSADSRMDAVWTDPFETQEIPLPAPLPASYPGRPVAAPPPIDENPPAGIPVQLRETNKDTRPAYLTRHIERNTRATRPQPANPAVRNQETKIFAKTEREYWETAPGNTGHSPAMVVPDLFTTEKAFDQTLARPLVRAVAAPSTEPEKTPAALPASPEPGRLLEPASEVRIPEPENKTARSGLARPETESRSPVREIIKLQPMVQTPAPVAAPKKPAIPKLTIGRIIVEVTTPALPVQATPRMMARITPAPPAPEQSRMHKLSFGLGQL